MALVPLLAKLVNFMQLLLLFVSLMVNSVQLILFFSFVCLFKIKELSCFILEHFGADSSSWLVIF